MNHTFTKDGSDFDGIPTYYKYYTGTTLNEDAKIIEHSLLQEPNQPPWKQFWDGFEPSNPKYKKEDYTLVVKDLKIKKVNGSGKPIEGIQFCQVQEYEKNNETIKSKNCGPNSNWITDVNGEVIIPIDELNQGESYLIEKIKKPQDGVKIDGHKANLKDESLKKETPIYVDYGVRFLGEVKGKDFIKYDELIAIIDGEINPKDIQYNDGYPTNTIGKVLSKGNDTTTGGNWLKIYDAREGKTLYIAKKPLTNYVSWDMLYKAGVVYGQEFINTKKGDVNIGKIKTKEELDKIGANIYQNFKNIEKNLQEEYIAQIIEINGKRYIIRLIKGTSRLDPNQINNINDFFNNEDFSKSEWNRYISILVSHYYNHGYNINTDEYYKKNGWPVGLVKYNWFGDLTLYSRERFKYNGLYYDYNYRDLGQRNWVQEYTTEFNYRALRGSGNYTYGAAIAWFGDYYNFYKDEYGFRPVLEEIQ